VLFSAVVRKINARRSGCQCGLMLRMSVILRQVNDRHVSRYSTNTRDITRTYKAAGKNGLLLCEM
jgi:hypothetical protein